MQESGYVERPDYRVDVRRKRNLVRVTQDGDVLAESTSALFVDEQDHGLVVYVPRADVRTEHLVASDQTSRCPYKGEASYWRRESSDDPIAWEYTQPYAEVAVIRDHIAFYQDQVQLQIGTAERTIAPTDCGCPLP